MGSNGSRYCLFSVDTSDFAQFPPQVFRPPGAEEIDVLSPSSADGVGRGRQKGQNRSDEMTEAAEPWLQRQSVVDIDAPPRPLEEEDATCLWGECCNVQTRLETFSSREMALTAARHFSEKHDLNRALSAYRQALCMRGGAKRPVVSPCGGAVSSVRGMGSSIALDDAIIFDELAQLCFEHNIQDKAALFCERATWLDAKNVEFWYRRGVVYQNSGNHKGAIECFNRCLQLQSDFVAAMFHLGVIQQRRGKHREAIFHFNALLDLEPAHTEALILAAECYDRLDMVHEALQCIDRVLIEDPTYFAAQKLRDRLRESAAAAAGNPTVAGQWSLGDSFDRQSHPMQHQYQTSMSNSSSRSTDPIRQISRDVTIEMAPRCPEMDGVCISDGYVRR